MNAPAVALAAVKFVFWSPSNPQSQAWPVMHEAVRSADIVVLQAAPQYVSLLNAVSSGAKSPEAARAVIAPVTPKEHRRFGGELTKALHRSGARVVSPEAGDQAYLREGLDRIAALNAEGNFEEALRVLAGLHARQGEELVRGVKKLTFENPEAKIVVLSRLPYTNESVRLARDAEFRGHARVERVFLPPTPIRFSPRDEAERRLLFGQQNRH